ncbi:hypothetical protein LEMLEM_LOCUS22681 [Lemmus lemmus]
MDFYFSSPNKKPRIEKLPILTWTKYQVQSQMSGILFLGLCQTRGQQVIFSAVMVLLGACGWNWITKRFHPISESGASWVKITTEASVSYVQFQNSRREFTGLAYFTLRPCL